MSGNYINSFQIGSNGINELSYEDSSCKATINVPDFRDRVWWTTISKVINKKSNCIEKVTLDQKFEIYRRISADSRISGLTGIFTSEFNFVEVDMNEIDYKTAILDM